jgi:5-methylcytosine-specific restriction endonuclease McrA
MSTNPLYQSPEWASLRLRRIAEERGICQGCGTRRASGARLIGHHARPLRTHPQLALDEENVVVLCPGCHEAVHWVAGRKLLVLLVQLASDPRLATARRIDWGAEIPQQLGLALEHEASNDETY